MYRLHDEVVNPSARTSKQLFDPSGLGLPPLFPAKRIVIAVCALLVAAVCNEALVARYFSSDGLLEPSTVFGIRLVQAVLVVSAVALVTSSRVPLLAMLLGLCALNVYASHAQAVAASNELERRALQAKLEELRSALAGVTHVGYITDQMSFGPDLRGPDVTVTGTASLERYLLTQYVVAPVVVEPGRTNDLIVGNFRTFNPQLTTGLTVVRDFGDGLVLLRWKAK